MSALYPRFVAFDPDILVSADQNDSQLLLVVEAERSGEALEGRRLEEVEAGLRRYMGALRCSLGAIVTPTRFRLYRDTFTSLTSESIELVGDFGLDDDLLRDAATIDDSSFENALQAWVESLREEPARAHLSHELRDAVEAHILPVLWLGHARAAHPRVPAFRPSTRP